MTGVFNIRGLFQNQPLIIFLIKHRNREKYFVIYKRYLHTDLSSLLSHYPNSGTCHTMAQVLYSFIKDCYRQVTQPAVYTVSELLVCLKAMSSQ